MPLKTMARSRIANLKLRDIVPPRKTADAAVLLFVVIALFFGLIIARVVPLFWGLDESAHFSRAYQVSEGKFLPEKLSNSDYGGLVPASVVSLDTATHLDLDKISLTPVIDRHDAKHLALQKTIASQRIDQPQKKDFNFPGSAAYSPIAYVAPAVGILVCRLANCSLSHTIVLARVFSLVAYVGVVAFGIWLLRKQKLKWLVFVIALLPIALFQAASVSADGPVIALSLLLFAIVAKTLSEKKLSTFLVIVLLLIALLIPLIKANYGIIDLSILLIANVLFKNKTKALVYTFAFVVIAALITLGWLYIARGPTKAISTLQASNPATHSFVSARQQGKLVLRKPLMFIGTIIRTCVLDEAFWVYSTVGEFALNAVQMPLTAIVYIYIMMIGCVFYAKEELVRYRVPAIILGAVSVLTALSIFGTLYLTFTVIGKSSIDGMQGRYFIPLLPFLLVAIGAVIPVRISMSPKTAMVLFSTSSCALLSLGVIYYGLATY